MLDYFPAQNWRILIDVFGAKGLRVSMIRTRHHQPSLWTGVLAEEVDDLREPWMRTADRLLDDEQPIEPEERHVRNDHPA
jgi:hypothetical protein